MNWIGKYFVYDFSLDLDLDLQQQQQEDLEDDDFFEYFLLGVSAWECLT